MKREQSSGWILLVVFAVILVAVGYILFFRGGEPDPLDSSRRASRSDTPSRVEHDVDPRAPRGTNPSTAASDSGDEAPTPIDPDREPMLRGVVTGPDGPVPRAEVRLYSMDGVYDLVSRLENQVVLTSVDNVRQIIDGVKDELVAFAGTAIRARADDSGEYAFYDVPESSFFALTIGKDHVFGYGDVLVAEEGATRTFDIELQRGDSIRGRVVDPQGGSVAGVTLLAVLRPPGMASFTKIARELMAYVNGEFLRGPLTVTTDASGDFAFDTLPRGTYDLIATRDGSAPAVSEAVRSGNDGVLVVLTPGARVSGRLVDTAGASVGDVIVRLEPTSDFSAIPIPGVGDMMRTFASLLEEDPIELVTADDGSFFFDPVSPGSYDLRVEVRGYIPLERPVTAKSGELTELGSLTLDAGESMYGRVVDESGAPVANALVSASPTEGMFGRGTDLSGDLLTGRTRVRSDDRGRFTIAGLASKPYSLTATAPGYGRAIVSDVRPGTATTLTMRPGWTVGGLVVRGDTGEPVEGVSVRAGGVVGETDAEGRFMLRDVTPGEEAPGGLAFDVSEDEPGSVRVVAKHPEYVAERERIDKETVDAGTARIELWPQPVIDGSVVGPNGEPLPGVLIRVVAPEEAPEFASDLMFAAATVTDLDGTFSVRSGALEFGGEVRIKASHVKYATTFSDNLELEADEAIPQVTLRMVPGGVIEGQVTDGSYPLAGVQVRLGMARENGRQEGMMLAMMGIPAGGRRVYTDDEGRYEFEKVAPGSYDVEAKGVHFADSETERAEIGDGGALTIDFTLDPGGVLDGSVTDRTGAPIAGARVRVFREGQGEEAMVRRMMNVSLQSTVTDDFGVFRLVGVPREPLSVSASADGFVTAEVDEVLPDAESVNLVLLTESRLAGVVVAAENGAPIHEFQVRLQRTDGEARSERNPFGMSDRWRSFQDSTGRFEFQSLEPGRYSIEVRALRYGLHRSEFRLREGESKSMRIALVESGVLTGRVVKDSDGKPVRGARVSFVRPEAEESGPWWGGMMGDSARTDADGYFEITEIPDGEQVLQVQHQDYILHREELNIGAGQSREIKVRLSEGMVVSGSARDRYDNAATGNMLLLRGEGDSKFAFVGQDGSFRFSGLAPGTYEIQRVSRGGGGGPGQEPEVLLEVVLEEESKTDVALTMEAVETRGPRGGG